MKIAAGAARGLEYLHDKANPPVIYRDLKSSNILLDIGFHPKLSDFGLAKLGPVGDKTHVSTRVMGTYGYCAPEYAMTGQLTLKSDVYSFGVVLVELVSAQLAVDMSRNRDDINLSSLALTKIACGAWKELVDPSLHMDAEMDKEGSVKAVLDLAFTCLQEEKDDRPTMKQVAETLIDIRRKSEHD